jgi:hypothetical protein
MAALVVAGGATRAAAAEPDASGPSVCAPPCSEAELCVGNRCVRPTEQSAAASPLPRDQQHPPPPASPPGSAPTTGPQPSAADANHPSPAAGPGGNSQPPPVAAAPAPSPPPQLRHDGDPWKGNTYTPTNTSVKRGVLFLPFLGVHSYVHEEANAYQPGLRFGAFLGGRTSDLVSLNGEVILDFSNVQGVQSTFSERAYHFVFSPLFDFAAGAVQLVVGPKLGIFVLSYEHLEGDISSSTELTGFSIGLNAGLFLPVSAHTSVGVLLSFDLAGANRSCVLGTGFGGGGEYCGSPAAQNPKILGMTGGVLF